MVALAVFRLGYVPKPCLAKPMLFAALECFEHGDLIGAGVRLREAANRFLVAAADWYGVEVKAKFLTPRCGMIRNDRLCSMLTVHAVATKQLANEAVCNLSLSSKPFIAEELHEAARNLCSHIQDAVLTLRADAQQLESTHEGKEGGA